MIMADQPLEETAVRFVVRSGNLKSMKWPRHRLEKQVSNQISLDLEFCQNLFL